MSDNQQFFKFDKWETLKDKVTGFTGVVMGRFDYATGCKRYSLQSKELKDGVPLEVQYFDEDQLELVAGEGITVEVRTAGGPMPAPKRY